MLTKECCVETLLCFCDKSGILQLMLNIALEQNKTPLPVLSASKAGVQLPPDVHALTMPAYEIDFKKAAGP
jgi:hypothetical protein